jgi:hypothetical protein
LALIRSRPADELCVGADTSSPVSTDYKTPAGFTGLIEDARIYWGSPSDAEIASWAAE